MRAPLMTMLNFLPGDDMRSPRTGLQCHGLDACRHKHATGLAPPGAAEPERQAEPLPDAPVVTADCSRDGLGHPAGHCTHLSAGASPPVEAGPSCGAEPGHPYRPLRLLDIQTNALWKCALLLGLSRGSCIGLCGELGSMLCLCRMYSCLDTNFHL